MASRPVALVTGASRGIGKEAALALARRGYNVAIAARTIDEGQKQSYGGQVTPMTLPGSLTATAQEIEATGVEALKVKLDLTDRASVKLAVPAVIERWGRIDVVVNNGVYQGEELRVEQQKVEDLDRFIEGNVIAPFILAQAALPHMRKHAANGTCAVINVSSGSARMDPPTPVGEGGWGWAYAGSKAGISRMAGVLAAELRGTGIRSINMDPGLVQTDLMDSRGLDFSAFGAVPPSVPGAAIAWLASEQAANDKKYNGKTVHGPKLAIELNLVEGYVPDKATAQSFTDAKKLKPDSKL